MVHVLTVYQQKTKIIFFVEKRFYYTINKMDLMKTRLLIPKIYGRRVQGGL